MDTRTSGHDISPLAKGLRPVKLKNTQRLPEQLNPSPLNPMLQEHVKDPTILVQFALTSQLWVPLVHSSTSEKLHQLELKFVNIQNIL